MERSTMNKIVGLVMMGIFIATVVYCIAKG